MSTSTGFCFQFKTVARVCLKFNTDSLVVTFSEVAISENDEYFCSCSWKTISFMFSLFATGDLRLDTVCDDQSSSFHRVMQDLQEVGPINSNYPSECQ